MGTISRMRMWTSTVESLPPEKDGDVKSLEDILKAAHLDGFLAGSSSRVKRDNALYRDGITAERERWRKALIEPEEELERATAAAIANAHLPDDRFNRHLARAALRAAAEQLAKA